MAEKIFENFIKDGDVSPEIYNKYKDLLPGGIILLWEKYGFGSFMGGYLRLINPDEYRELVVGTYFRGDISIPIFVTAFGDIITWEKNRYVGMIKYKNGFYKLMAAGFDFFLEDLQNGSFNKDFFDLPMYEEAVNMWGNVMFDECFGFVPLLSLGGSEKAENLKKVKTKEHIEMISQSVGKIETISSAVPM